MIFDSHTHYDDSAFDEDRELLLASLAAGGVGRVCNIGATMQGARDSVRFSETYDFVYAAVGVHPDECFDFGPSIHADDFVSAERNPVFQELKELLGRSKVQAVGEIGLDYHGFDVYEVKPDKETQAYWFEKQLELAIELDLPVVIHSRNASLDTMEMMKKAHANGLTDAVIHCYSYSREVAEQYLKMGYYLGFGGVITYEGQKKLTKALEAAPLDRILLETDSPYLTPVPVRKVGEWSRNSSLYLPHVVKKIAEIKGVTPEEIEQITWDNANRFFRIAD